MEEPEDDDEKKYFKESVEHVRFGIGEKDEGKEGADAAVHDCGADVGQGLLDSLLSTSDLFHQEPVSDVSAVVDAEPNGDDEVDARDGVDGQAPEVHEAADVDQGDDDHDED